MTDRWFPDSMPAPAASAETLPWWQAAAEHRLVFQRCGDCGRLAHPPAPVCPNCRGSSFSFEEQAGAGSIFTFTLVHQVLVPDLRVPYVVAVVEIDGAEGNRLVTNIVDSDPEDVRIGARVELVWEDMGPELSLPRARLVTAKG